MWSALGLFFFSFSILVGLLLHWRRGVNFLQLYVSNFVIFPELIHWLQLFPSELKIPSIWCAFNKLFPINHFILQRIFTLCPIIFEFNGNLFENSGLYLYLKFLGDFLLWANILSRFSLWSFFSRCTFLLLLGLLLFSFENFETLLVEVRDFFYHFDFFSSFNRLSDLFQVF